MYPWVLCWRVPGWFCRWRLVRWVPIAVLGLVLLAVGATYEARLRDLGRLRTALGRMR